MLNEIIIFIIAPLKAHQQLAKITFSSADEITDSSRGAGATCSCTACATPGSRRLAAHLAVEEVNGTLHDRQLFDRAPLTFHLCNPFLLAEHRDPCP